jgi:hypothetical protein
MDVELYDPNPAIAYALIEGCRTGIETLTHLAQAMWMAEVAKRTGRLAGSSHTEVAIGGVHNDRLVGHLIVGVGIDYGAAHQFGHWQDEGNLIGSDFAAGESTHLRRRRARPEQGPRAVGQHLMTLTLPGWYDQTKSLPGRRERRSAPAVAAAPDQRVGGVVDPEAVRIQPDTRRPAAAICGRTAPAARGTTTRNATSRAFR